MLMIATPHHIVQTSVQYGKEGDFMTSVKTSLIFALRCAKRKAGDYALRLRAVRVQAAAARAAADAYIAEKAAEFGIDQTEVNGSASSSAAVAETAEAAVAETAVAVVVETAVAETAETESAVVAVGQRRRWRRWWRRHLRPRARPRGSQSAGETSLRAVSGQWCAPWRRPRTRSPCTSAESGKRAVGPHHRPRVHGRGVCPPSSAEGERQEPRGDDSGEWARCHKSAAGAPSRRRKEFDCRSRSRRALSGSAGTADGVGLPRLHGLARTRQRRGKEDGGHGGEQGEPWSRA